MSGWSAWRRWGRAFTTNKRGATAAIFALALPVLILAVGGGIDLSRAYSYRQKLASTVDQACAQSALEINYKIANGANYYSDFSPLVNTIMTTKTSQAGLGAGVTSSSKTAFSNIAITATGSSKTIFSGIVNKAAYPVGLTRSCRYMQDNQKPPTGTNLFVESFEQNHNVAVNNWTVLGFNGSATSGASWNGWTTTNAGIEINGQSQLAGGTVKFGSFFAELDSDCLGFSNCHSNSTMSRILNLTPGDYELRYWYISRLLNSDPNWTNVVACGKDTDANVAPYRAWQGETNRIEVYVEKSGAYNYSSTGLVDVCVYSDHWVERVIPIKVTSTSPYRISWRAAGREDTFGGLIDYLRFCTGTCP